MGDGGQKKTLGAVQAPSRKNRFQNGRAGGERQNWNKLLVRAMR
jgi:hypothetical protein